MLRELPIYNRPDQTRPHTKKEGHVNDFISSCPFLFLESFVCEYDFTIALEQYTILISLVRNLES